MNYPTNTSTRININLKKSTARTAEERHQELLDKLDQLINAIQSIPRQTIVQPAPYVWPIPYQPYPPKPTWTSIAVGGEFHKAPDVGPTINS